MRVTVRIKVWFRFFFFFFFSCNAQIFLRVMSSYEWCFDSYSHTLGNSGTALAEPLSNGSDYTDERPGSREPLNFWALNAMRMRCALYGRTSVYCTNIVQTNGTKMLFYVQNSAVYDNFYSKQTQTADLCPAT